MVLHPDRLSAGKTWTADRRKNVPVPVSRLLVGGKHNALPHYTEFGKTVLSKNEERALLGTTRALKVHENFYHPNFKPNANSARPRQAHRDAFNNATKGNYYKKLVQAWARDANVELAPGDIKKIGGGAFGYVTAVPARLVQAIQKNPRAFGLTNWVSERVAAPKKGVIAAKFQVIKPDSKYDDRLVSEALAEQKHHKLLRKPGAAHGNIPPISQYIPEYYGGGFMKALGLHVIFMEKVEGTELFKVLWKSLTPTLHTRVKKAIAALWSRGFLHGDAHGGNIIITKTGQVKIIDFGMLRPLPTSLRPRSLAAAQNSAYLRKLNAYASSRATSDWHNPNTRLVQILPKYVRKQESPRAVAGRNSSSNGSGSASPMSWKATSPPISSRRGSPMNWTWGGRSSRR